MPLRARGSSLHLSWGNFPEKGWKLLRSIRRRTSWPGCLTYFHFSFLGSFPANRLVQFLFLEGIMRVRDVIMALQHSGLTESCELTASFICHPGWAWGVGLRSALLNPPFLNPSPSPPLQTRHIWYRSIRWIRSEKSGRASTSRPVR